jgi:hypothetical protein
MVELRTHVAGPRRSENARRHDFPWDLVRAACVRQLALGVAERLHGRTDNVEGPLKTQ